MKKRVAFPFLTLSDNTVQAGQWDLALNEGDFAHAGDFLPHWDSASSIKARRTVRIDPDLASRELGLARDDLRLVVLVRIGTGAGRLPCLVVLRKKLEYFISQPQIDVNLELSGSSLSMLIDLATDVVLASAPETRDTLSPTRVGDRVWSDQQKVRLEGQELRFPIEAIDLRGMLGDPDLEAAIPWFVHWNSGDWTRDFHGAFRLLLNTESQEITQSIENEEPLVLQAIMADAMTQLCEGLVRTPDAEEILAQCDLGTLGAQASSWLKLAWPGKNLSFARSLLENKPNEFRAAILAAAQTRHAGD